ncbi:hypothetical protein [Dysgonomonas sp.]|jgi:hypothetical protein|nr:hypothetical protein [Prevotella sp.]
MKIVKYIGILLVMCAFASCEKHEIEFDAIPLTDEAEFQIHHFVPVTPSNADFYIYRIDVNNVNITNNKVSLSSYNAQPSAGIGLYYVAPSGSTNIKLYYRKNGEDVLMYDRNVTLSPGKQNVVVHNFDKDPCIFNAEYPYVIDRKTYDTDTIAYVKFYNLLYETPAAPTTLKLQYQYRKNWVHPLYTLDDLKNNRIPEGKKVGDATGTVAGVDVGPWTNLGAPVAFGETTGWQVVPVEKNTYVSQGAARIDYRIKVIEGGTVGVNMNADGLLLSQTTSGTAPVVYSDWWNSTVGRRIHHFFSGTRTGKPGSAIRTFTAL